MKKIKLPSIKGKFGDWIYFNAVMKVKDIADQRRIATVSEIPELYPKNISEVLQREIDGKRINKISEYLRTHKERFISTMIVAIHKGLQEWSEIRVEESFNIEGESLSDEETLYLDGRLGILSLNGNESIFVLDGQHRLRGIRDAYKLSPETVGNDDVSLTFVVHNSSIKERTRRLFTTLNRYAEKPKKAELIIMEEDDAAAVLTRRLILTHPIFRKDNAISKTRDFAMPSTDYRSFTTLVCLYEITKVIIDYNTLYPKKKPLYRLPSEALEELYEEKLLPFWEFFFETFPSIVRFINEDHDPKFRRNRETGGSLLLRPEAQLILATMYKHFLNKGDKSFSEFRRKLSKIDFQLDNNLWKYVFWLGSKMNIGNKKLKSQLFIYLLGENTDEAKIQRDLAELYENYNDVYGGHVKPIK